MGIVDRTQQVVSSNFNALLRRLEEPGRDLALLLSEMKNQVLAAQRELLRLVGESKQLEAKHQSLGAEILKWEERAMLAIRHGDDSLAREALQQKRRLSAEQQQLSNAREEYQVAIAELKREVLQMRKKQSEKERTGAVNLHLSQAREGVATAGSSTDGGPLADFHRWEDNLVRQESEIAAAGEVDALLARGALGAMSDGEVEARFQALEVEEPVVGQSETTSPGDVSEGTSASGAPPDKNAEDASIPKVRIRVEP